MSLRMITTQQKLDFIEDMIDQQKNDEYALDMDVAILKELAKDLRAQLAGAASVAQTRLEQRLEAVMRSKTGLGYSQNALIGVGEELIGRWPVVRQALGRFGAEIEGGNNDVSSS